MHSEWKEKRSDDQTVRLVGLPTVCACNAAAEVPKNASEYDAKRLPERKVHVY